jgi:hypothetical protein
MRHFFQFLAVTVLIGNLAACQRSPSVTPSSPVTTVRAVRIDYSDLSPTSAIMDSEELLLQQAGINLVGVGAGRVDWAYFPWLGHSDTWAPSVHQSGIDFLARDASRFGKWAEVTAVVDVLAPLYIQSHPEAVALSWGGQPSLNLVSLTQMTSGDFNQKLVDFVSAVSTRTQANSVTLVELFYYVDGFGQDDLQSFQKETGLSDWPMLATGEININESSITGWRNHQLEILVKQLADIIHQNNKEFYLEVNPTQSQIDNQDWSVYELFLRYADKLIIFGNSIFTNTDITSVSLSVQNLNDLGSDRLIYELGLWQDDNQRTTRLPMAMTPESFQALYLSAKRAGVAAFWFTPSYLISPAHWGLLSE